VFKAKVAMFLPGTKEPTIKLILIAGDQPAREFQMKGKDGVFEVSAIPAPKSGGGRIEVSVRLGSGMVAGMTDDITLQVGSKPIKLSQLSRLDLKPKPSALLADLRTTVDGEVGSLGLIDIILGDDKLKVDLRKASQVRLSPTYRGVLRLVEFAITCRIPPSSIHLLQCVGESAASCSSSNASRPLIPNSSTARPALRRTRSSDESRSPARVPARLPHVGGEPTHCHADGLGLHAVEQLAELRFGQPAADRPFVDTNGRRGVNDPTRRPPSAPASRSSGPMSSRTGHRRGSGSAHRRHGEGGRHPGRTP